MTEPLPDPFPGEYRIRRLLGEGAFGKVWLADDLNLGRRVALKTLKLRGDTDERHAGARGPADGGPAPGRRAASQHRPGARLAAGRTRALSRAAVRAGGLAGRACRGPGRSPGTEAARYVADVGEGLLEVHARGIVHRDIKPANILWDPGSDEALLTDFGVSSRLADAGTVAGTPAYMAPEAFEGRVTPALDVYGLAATLFRLITGEPPFPGTGIPNIIYQIERGLSDPDPRCRSMPEANERIIRSGLASDPDRTATA